VSRTFCVAIAAATLVAQGLPGIGISRALAEAATFHARCESSTITAVTPYFAGDPSSGIVVVFASRIGVERFKTPAGEPLRAQIVDRLSARTAPIYRTRSRDRVIVCLESVPPAGDRCDPAQDPRGRVYAVRDQTVNVRFFGTNGEHGCGGA
jgi:hypothetical protein